MMEKGDGLHIPLDGNSLAFAIHSVPVMFGDSRVLLRPFPPVGRNLRQRNPFRANTYRFPAEEDDIVWVEYRFKLVIQKMVVVILILLVMLLFQLYS